jgi:hypothetical protein
VRNLNIEEGPEGSQKRLKIEEPVLMLETKQDDGMAGIEISDIKDEASGPSTVSFAPIIEQDREFSFQHKFDS